MPLQNNENIEIPDMYYVPDAYSEKTSIKDTIKKVDLMGLITPWFEHTLLMIATCAGISFGIDAFDRSCNKAYDKSILGKAAKFGDSIETSSIVQNENVQKGLSWLQKSGQEIRNFAMKSNIIKAMVETPTKPENASPKSELVNKEQRVLYKFNEIMRKLKLTEDSADKPITLKDLALSKDEVKNLKQKFGVTSLAKVEEEKVTARAIMESLGYPEAEIESVINGSDITKTVKSKILEAMKIDSEFVNNVAKDETGKYAKQVEEATGRVLNKVKVNQGMGIFKMLGIGQTTSMQEVYNRLHSMSDGAKTKTGKFMSNLLQNIHRGFTFGGTKFGVMLFVAPLLVETMLNTKKAEAKEKVSTFINGLVNAVSWVFVFPIALRTIHAIGGAQYAGMGKEKVKELEDAIKKFNKRVDNNEFTDKVSYQTAKNELKAKLKDLRKVKKQNLFTKMVRGISRATKWDLLKVKGYNGGSKTSQFVNKLPNFLKDAVYSPARFLVFMLALVPFYDKIITKCTKAIFGNYYDGMKEEEYEEKKKEQKKFLKRDLTDRLYEAQARKLAATGLAAAPVVAAESINPETNAAEIPQEEAVKEEAGEIKEKDVKEFTPETKSQPIQELRQQADTIETKKQTTTQKSETIPPKVDNYTYLPSQDSVFGNELKNTVSKYIPSQLGANFNKIYDNSGLDAALRRADRAEERAIKILSGKYGSVA